VAEADLLARRGPDRRRVTRPLLDRGHELVAAAVDGPDAPLGRSVVADGSPCLLDARRQGRLAHEAVAPDPVEQLGLHHDPVAVRDEIREHVEHLRLDVHHRPAPTQLDTIGVELALREHQASRAHHSFRSGSRGVRRPMRRPGLASIVPPLGKHRSRARLAASH
jgi:hypothetical protein